GRTPGTGPRRQSAGPAAAPPRAPPRGRRPGAGPPQLRREGRGPGLVTAGEDELGVEGPGEESGDAGAEDAGAAEDEDPAGHPSGSRSRARTSGGGTGQVSRRPNSR